jgi:DNA-binding NarL/FixJ family response regulator
VADQTRKNQTRTAVLVDEHPLWLDAVERVLASLPVDVVGKALSLAEGTQLLNDHRPDLLVLETAMRNGSKTGFEWLEETKQTFPELAPVVLSTSDDPTDIAMAVSLGASAYVVKKAQAADLVIAVRQVYEQSVYLPGTIDPGRTVTVDKPDSTDLTRRELETLVLVAEGMSNAQLARALWVTPQTVKFHLSNIYRKLGVSNRTEASRWAQVNGLLPAEPGGEANG